MFGSVGLPMSRSWTKLLLQWARGSGLATDCLELETILSLPLSRNIGEEGEELTDTNMIISKVVFQSDRPGGK